MEIISEIQGFRYEPQGREPFINLATVEEICRNHYEWDEHSQTYSFHKIAIIQELRSRYPIGLKDAKEIAGVVIARLTSD